MRAVTVTRFGDFGVLRSAEVPPPAAGRGQLLVQVAFAGVNHVDWQLREGWYAAAEEVAFPYVPGWAVAGTVVEAGPGVSEFVPHDRVFAYCRGPRLHGGGSYCELMALDAAVCARVPDGVDLATAAAWPVVALTAWQAVHRVVTVADRRVLVLGAAGGVGRQLVQMARARGATVEALAAPVHHERLASLGAGALHSDPDLLPSGSYDVVVDCAGMASVEAAYRALRPGGRFLGIAGEPDASLAARHRVEPLHWFSEPNGAELAEIVRRAEAGELEPPRAISLPLEEARAAQEMVRLRATAGRRVVLRVAPEERSELSPRARRRREA